MLIDFHFVGCQPKTDLYFDIFLVQQSLLKSQLVTVSCQFGFRTFSKYFYHTIISAVLLMDQLEPSPVPHDPISTKEESVYTSS